MSDEATTDQFTRLFDLAHDPEAAAVAGLSPEEQAELERIRETLHYVDMHWHVSAATHSRIQQRFFEELAANQPDHPWLQLRPITTIGDLIRTSNEDAPPVSDESYSRLAADTTPLAQIVDPAQRVTLIARITHRAKLPKADISKFMLWLNRVLADLIPSGSAQQIQAFRRRQQPPRNDKR